MIDQDAIARIVGEVISRYPAGVPEEHPPAVPAERVRSVALAADHGGVDLKNLLRGYMEDLGYAVKDFGTYTRESVDYPDYAARVAHAVAAGEYDRGIVIDGAGIGSCMAANKVRGIRAAMCYDLKTALNSREHNDANVLTLGGPLLEPRAAREIVKVWLETPFGGGRHQRRVDKIMAIENQGYETGDQG
ncbi:MAG: ribose 5-phosphate isomerase B [Candidatus Aureabacteria bacterium]|nr:ribose 5-phosphate isomerase B [Candidatus Auribacterota bacterium]